MDSLDLLHYGWYVGIKIHYRLSTNSYIINILSYTVLDDDISYEKLSSKLEEAEVQGLIM